jgi:hypothetical protein
MATIKRIPDTYDIYVPEMTIHGNLNVSGTTTNINSTTIDVDNRLVFNANLGANPSINALIEVNRSISGANTSVRWNEATTSWQLTNNGTTFYNILTAGGIAGNINITGITLYDTANTVTMYTGTVSSGKSGLFVDNTIGTKQELATKSAAIAYSIIFG